MADSGEENPIATQWFAARLQQVLTEIEDHFSKFRISDAQGAIYKLIWDDFCAGYLEMVKPVYGQPIGPKSLAATIAFFDELMRVLHPFMPFVTEEVWQTLVDRQHNESICIAAWPGLSILPYNQEHLDQGNRALDIIKATRSIKASEGMSPYFELGLQYYTTDINKYNSIGATVSGMTASQITFHNIEDISKINLQSDKFKVAIIDSDQLVIQSDSFKNFSSQKPALEKELVYLQGFLVSVDAKLQNDRFVANAKPELIEKERQKKADAEAKIAMLAERLG